MGTNSLLTLRESRTQYLEFLKSQIIKEITATCHRSIQIRHHLIRAIKGKVRKQKRELYSSKLANIRAYNKVEDEKGGLANNTTTNP